MQLAPMGRWPISDRTTTVAALRLHGRPTWAETFRLQNTVLCAYHAFGRGREVALPPRTEVALLTDSEATCLACNP